MERVEPDFSGIIFRGFWSFTYFSRRPRKCVRDPREPYHIARVYTWHHQHHGEITRSSRSRCSSKDEGKYCKVERQSDMEIALARSICVPRI